MSPIQTAALIYAIVAVIVATTAAYGVRKVRKAGDCPEKRDALASWDKLGALMNLGDSGCVVFIGLIWPLALLDHVRRGGRA